MKNSPMAPKKAEKKGGTDGKSYEVENYILSKKLESLHNMIGKFTDPKQTHEHLFSCKKVPDS